MKNKYYILTKTLIDFKEQMDLQTLLAKTGGIGAFLITYLFNVTPKVEPLFGAVVVRDEIVQGIIRLAFGTITALIIMIITDIYKYIRDRFKNKIKTKKDETTIEGNK